MGESETQELLGYFAYDHLPEHLQARSKPFHDLAHMIAEDLSDTPTVERAAAIRKVLEAKDCFVRAGLKKG
jgi:hypothetical protein